MKKLKDKLLKKIRKKIKKNRSPFNLKINEYSYGVSPLMCNYHVYLCYSDDDSIIAAYHFDAFQFHSNTEVVVAIVNSSLSSNVLKLM